MFGLLLALCPPAAIAYTVTFDEVPAWGNLNYYLVADNLFINDGFVIADASTLSWDPTPLWQQRIGYCPKWRSLHEHCIHVAAA